MKGGATSGFGERPRWQNCCVFFFQAEDGIRDYKVTGVQTCALPIWTPQTAEPGGAVALGAGPNEGVVRDLSRRRGEPEWLLRLRLRGLEGFRSEHLPPWRSEERRVGKEGRSRGWPECYKKKPT